MLERLKNALPPYFVDKFEGVDKRQVDALPVNIRRGLIHGSNEEFNRALSDLRARERLQGKRLLGEAGRELIYDMRSMAQQSR